MVEVASATNGGRPGNERLSIHPARAVEWRIAADRLAIVAADGVFSHYDLAQAAARVAAELTIDGDLRHQRVAFLVPPSFAYVVIARGIWLAGGVAVPLAVSHPPAELEHVIRDSGASIVVGGGRQAAALETIAASVGARFVRTADLLAGDSDRGQVSKTARRGFGDLTPSSPALILYTSGTTGRPKGVVLTHGHYAAQVTSLLEGLGVDARRPRAPRPPAPSRARHRQRARLRPRDGRRLRDPAAVRDRGRLGAARVGRHHGLLRRADHLPAPDPVVRRRAARRAARADGGVPARPADDVGIGRASRADARALARD